MLMVSVVQLVRWLTADREVRGSTPRSNLILIYRTCTVRRHGVFMWHSGVEKADLCTSFERPLYINNLNYTVPACTAYLPLSPAPRIVHQRYCVAVG